MCCALLERRIACRCACVMCCMCQCGVAIFYVYVIVVLGIFVASGPPGTNSSGGLLRLSAPAVPEDTTPMPGPRCAKLVRNRKSDFVVIASSPRVSIFIAGAAGKYADEGAATCEMCPAGTVSNASATACQRCPEGMLSYPGTVECLRCSDN